MQLRSVELQVADRIEATKFMTASWGLIEVVTRNHTTFLRGSASLPYIISLKQGQSQELLSVTLTGNLSEIKGVWQFLENSQLQKSNWIDHFDEPGQGCGFKVQGLFGETFRFIAESDPPPAEFEANDSMPIRLAHVVLNSPDLHQSSQSLADSFGFRVTDRTKNIHFVGCNELHHVIAYAASESKRSLHHIAFELPTAESVLKGMGRLKDAGCPWIWGPGRHGPGNNVFAYFMAPFGACIEYTSEISRIDDSYPVGTPDSWTWPEGRNDQWGIATRNPEKLKATSEAFPFAVVDF